MTKGDDRTIAGQARERARQEKNKYKKKIRAIRELHVKQYFEPLDEGAPDSYCVECDRFPYPCPTIALLEDT